MKGYFMYCRKSSEAEDRQVLSIPSQTDVLSKCARRAKAKVLEEMSEAKSAKAPGARPIFDSMMERIYAGEADGILCWKLDRLARNPWDGAKVIWAVTQHGIRIMTPVQTYGPADIIWMYVEFGMAHKYVDDLSANVRRGLQTKAEMGWLPNQPPLGYMNKMGPDGRKVIIRDPERFETIRKCWDLVLDGEHTPAEVRNIATTVLGLKGVHGRPIGRTTLYNVFANPFYYGLFEYPKGSGTWHVGRHMPMVTKDQFDLVQRLLARSKKLPYSRHVHAYTGLIKCGSCGGAVTADQKHQAVCPECHLKFPHRRRVKCPRCRFPVLKIPKSNFRLYTYYHCARKVNPECREASVRSEALNEEIAKHLQNVRMPDLHRFWIGRSFERLNGKSEDVLAIVRRQFNASARDIQRKIVMAIFKDMVLRGKRLTVSLCMPFSFRDLAHDHATIIAPAN